MNVQEYEETYANKLDNLDEIDKFLKHKINHDYIVKKIWIKK
jgi:hypothetical protein